jgi:hypothetical protein
VNGELIGGRYQLERLIGQASSARVFRARDSVLGRTVALKLLAATGDSAAAERFRAEARAAARLVHANLLTVIDRGQEQGRDYVVFEYLGGETLRDRLRREGPLAVHDVLALGVQLASALAFVEEKEGAQRELQPESVLLGEAGQVKLADFGMALEGFVDEDTLPHGEAEEPDPAPSPAVELRAGDEVRSLGCLLYELLTGLPPADAEEASLLEERRPDCPERLRVVVTRALQASGREPPAGDAIGSMLELKRELELCRGELERSERRARVHEAATGVVSAATLPPAPAPLVEPALVEAVSLAVQEPGARPRRRLGFLVVPAFLVVAAAGGAAYYLLTGGAGKKSPGSRPPLLGAVHLRAVTAYDPPPGDGREDNGRLSLATDGNPSTAWASERYTTQHFGNLKSGVGLVVRAERPVRLRVLAVRTDTPGFTAMVKAGSSERGPFRDVARPRTVRGSSSFLLDTSRAARYYVLWITDLSPGTAPSYHVDVNEISAGQTSVGSGAS